MARKRNGSYQKYPKLFGKMNIKYLCTCKSFLVPLAFFYYFARFVEAIRLNSCNLIFSDEV